MAVLSSSAVTDGPVAGAPVVAVAGDVFGEPADLVVVPVDTGGTTSASFAKVLASLGLRAPRHPMAAGDVSVVAGSGSTLVAFAAVVSGRRNEAADLSGVGARLADLAHQLGGSGTPVIATPLLGTGAGGLAATEAVPALVDGFFSAGPPAAQLRIHTLDPERLTLLQDLVARSLAGRTWGALGGPGTAGPGEAPARGAGEEGGPAGPADPVDPVDPLVGVETELVSDLWTLEDELGRLAHARALVDFIVQRETRPPLTLSIAAQWGGGKTSLMRMVRERLDPLVPVRPEARSAARSDARPDARSDARSPVRATIRLTAPSRAALLPARRWFGTPARSPGADPSRGLSSG